MKLGCADYSFPSLPNSEALHLVSRLGFEGVDLGLFADRSEVAPAIGPSDIAGIVSRLRPALDKTGLAVADLFVQVSGDFTKLAINDPAAGVRSRALNQLIVNLDLAVAIGAPGMTVLPGVLFPDGWEASIERAADTLASLVSAAKERGLGLSVEPHVQSVIDGVAKSEELLARTPGLTLTLDHAHFVRVGELQPTIDRLLPHARHIQARGGSPTQLQAPIAENVIDFRAVVRQLLAMGYQGWISTEYVWSAWYDCNRVDNLSETVALRDLLRTAIG